MKLILAIGAGGFIGAVFRYLLSQLIQTKLLSTLPYSTLMVNIIGCLLIGFAVGFSEKGSLPYGWWLFLVTGVLGGFTTFSAFSNETVSLMRDGQLLYASLYVLASVVVGLIATFVGITIVKYI